MKERKINLALCYYISLLFLEIVFNVVCVKHLSFSLVNELIYLIPISFILSFIGKLFKNPKVNYFINLFITFCYAVLFSVEVVFKNTFKVFFSIRTMGLANQITSFMNDVLISIWHNIFFIILLFIPFILMIILRKKINFAKSTKREKIAYLVGLILGYLLFFGSLFIGYEEENSVYELYNKIDNMALYKEKMGVIASLNLDIKRLITGFNTEIKYEAPHKDKEEKEEEKVYDYNNLDIDFPTLISNETNPTLKNMHEYFSEEEGTKQNEYTGMFKGKNLILFMAESFNEIAVREDVTPTLYKLVNSGFTFNNFYSPVILSTIGGEFQELTGLYPDISDLSSIWRRGTNKSYGFGIANVFKDLGYNTYAYHNNQYNFQNRDTYLKTLGFDYYKGCYNGLDINCSIWPESDVEMIEKTVDEYVDSENPFLVYYATVSGHMGYSWSNSMSYKNKEAVIDLPYSTSAKAYLATQVELDKALELLINKLEEKGILDDTVIALVGDHYPYALDLSVVNELASYKKDGNIEINRSNFILWNNKMDNVKVDKVGSQIDVLPTIYNVFGIPYDSRLIIGKDILSSTDGLAIFANFSWVSDYGTYEASTGVFTAKEGKEVPEGYVSKMNNIVQNKIAMSKLLLEKNYYTKVTESE